MDYREEDIECVKDCVLPVHQQIYAKYDGSKAFYSFLRNLNLTVGSMSGLRTRYFEDVYKDIEPSLFHNMILSVEQLCSLYHDGIRPIYLPFYKSDVIHKNCLVFPVEVGYKYEHIVAFLDYFYMLISSVTIMYIEFTTYIYPRRLKRLYIEKE